MGNSCCEHSLVYSVGWVTGYGTARNCEKIDGRKYPPDVIVAALNGSCIRLLSKDEKENPYCFVLRTELEVP